MREVGSASRACLEQALTQAGKSLRVPGTNPFFPLLHAYQGNRMLELMKNSPMDVYLMNTGRIEIGSINGSSGLLAPRFIQSAGIHEQDATNTRARARVTLRRAKPKDFAVKSDAPPEERK